MEDTYEICKFNNATYITRKGGNFYGDEIRTGISKASGMYMLIINADGSHEQHSIIDIYNKITNQGLDIVVRSRCCKGGKTDNNFILKMMSWSLNHTYKTIFSIN